MNKRIDRIIEDIENLEVAASTLIMTEIERLATAELKQNKSLKSFTIGMGCCFFTDVHNHDLSNIQDFQDFNEENKTFEIIDNLITEYAQLKLTGNSLHVKLYRLQHTDEEVKTHNLPTVPKVLTNW